MAIPHYCHRYRNRMKIETSGRYELTDSEYVARLLLATKNAVLVLPLNKVGVELGVFMNAASVAEILLEIQAFMFRRLGFHSMPRLGRIALAGFSAGNTLVTTFLRNGAAASHPLYLNNLKEVYLFEPGARL